MDMQNELRELETAQDELNRIDFDQYASYEDDDSLVVCDRENASAWVKCDVTVELRD